MTASEAGATPAIEAHADRRAALEGADFAINMIQVGGHAGDRDRLRDPEALRAAPDRSATRSASAASSARCARSRSCRGSAATCPRSARTPGSSTTPTRWRCSAGPPTAARRCSKVVGLCHSVQNTTRQLAEMVERAVRRGQLPRRRGQPPGLHPALRARRREPLPGARRGDRARPGAAAAGADADLPHLRLLPDRVEQPLGRVPALVHAPRRRDRADADRRVELPGGERGEPGRVRAQPRAAGERRAARRSSPRSSTRRRSSTRSSPASRGSSTATSRTPG